MVSTRSESKRLDNLGVDVADKENVLPFYVQCKNTKSTPPVELISQAKVTDKPLVIFWNKRVQRNENCISGGEFVFVSKQFFYNLIKCCDTELPDHLDIEEFVKRKSKI